jgi:hypothetical protein
MDYLTIFLALSAALVVLFGVIWFIRVAFQESRWWGFGVFIPLLSIVFLVYKWPAGKGPLIAVTMGTFMLLIFYPSARISFEESQPLQRASFLSFSSRSREEVAAEHLEKERIRLKELEAKLQHERRNLNSSDANAVRRLTLQIEDYNLALSEYQRLAALQRAQQVRKRTAALAKTPDSDGWTLDLSQVDFPASAVKGRMTKMSFVPDKAVITNGNLSFRQGSGLIPDIELIVVLGIESIDELTGRLYSINPDLSRVAPEVHKRLRKKEGDFPEAQIFPNGYAMRLEFGAPSNGEIPGRIYLSLPDKSKSYLAGTFRAVYKN